MPDMSLCQDMPKIESYKVNLIFLKQYVFIIFESRNKELGKVNNYQVSVFVYAE